MAISEEQRRANRRAQRRVARELRDVREGRATWRKSDAGRAYSRALARMAAPVLVIEHVISVLRADEIRHDREMVEFNVNRMTLDQRELTLTFDAQTVQFYASIQSSGNVWWYHRAGQDYYMEWTGKAWSAPVSNAP